MSLEEINTGSKRKAGAALEGQFDDSDQEGPGAGEEVAVEPKKEERVESPADKTTSKETASASGKFLKTLTDAVFVSSSDASRPCG